METEQKDPSSKNGPDQKKTLYDQFLETLPTHPARIKPSKGMLDKLADNFRQVCCEDSSNNIPDAARPPPSTAGSNGNATQNNNTGEGSSSKKKTIIKTYRAPPQALIRGFVYDVMSLEIMLLHGDPFKILGVVGLPGVGKTTLCWYILNFNDKVKEKYVGQKIWMTQVKKPEIDEESVEVIIIESDKEQLGGSPDDLNHEGSGKVIIIKYSDEQYLPGLLDDLNNKLKDQYLIVIDDVGEGERGDNWFGKLKDHFTDKLAKDKEGAIIVTCRSEKTGKELAGELNVHLLKPLSDPESCWLIYRDAANPDVKDEEQRVSTDVMQELMKKSGGLPAAAQMMGKIKAQKMKEHKEQEQIKAQKMKEHKEQEQIKKANQSKSTIQS